MKDTPPGTGEFIQAKALEEGLGFVCFQLKIPGIPGEIEGIVNISQSMKAGGSGQIATAFLLDAGGNNNLRQDLEFLFAKLDFSDLVGRSAQTVLRTSVAFALNPDFAMEEFTFYFSELEGRQRKLVQKVILPAFAKRLEIRFQPVNWFPSDERPKRGKQAKFMALISRFTSRSNC